MNKRFSGSCTRRSALPKASLSAAKRVLKSAALHHYQSDDLHLSDTAQLEQDFAVASGGQALLLALRATGVDEDICCLIIKAPVDALQAQTRQGEAA